MAKASNTRQTAGRRRWMIAGVWLLTAGALTVAAVAPGTGASAVSAPAVSAPAESGPAVSGPATYSSHPSTASMPAVATTSKPSSNVAVPTTWTVTLPATTVPVIPPRPTGPIAPPAPGPLTRPDPVPPPRTEPAPAPTTQSAPVVTPPVVTPPVVTPPVVTPPVVAPAPSQPEVIDDRVKYWMAFTAGKRLRDELQQGSANPDDLNVMRGILDGLQGKDPAYSRKEIEEQIARMLNADAQKRAAKNYADDPAFRNLADENRKRSQEAIEQFAKLDGTETRSDGVLVRVLDAGNGRVMGNAKSVTVKVRVELADGSLVKETDPNQTITIATSDLLPALAEDCRGMKVGAHWRLMLPPDVAYGMAGKPPLVGPNQAVIYDIQLSGAQ